MVDILRIWPKIGLHHWHTRKSWRVVPDRFFLNPPPSIHPLKNVLARETRPSHGWHIRSTCIHARGVLLPPNRPYPTTHLHPALFKFLFSALTELAGLHDIPSSLRFLSSLLGGCTPRGVVGSELWVSTSVPFTLHQWSLLCLPGAHRTHWKDYCR